jgi:hypothetical protein
MGYQTAGALLLAGALSGRWRQFGAFFAMMRSLAADTADARIVLDSFIPLGAFTTFASDVCVEL